MKRLALTLILTFGLAYPASGQDWFSTPRSELLLANLGYALDLADHICGKHTPQSLLTKLELVVLKSERGEALAEGCQGNLRPPCHDALDNLVDESLPLLDRLIATLETTPRQCLFAYEAYLDQQLIAIDHANAELENILLSGE